MTGSSDMRRASFRRSALLDRTRSRDVDALSRGWSANAPSKNRCALSSASIRRHESMRVPSCASASEALDWARAPIGRRSQPIAASPRPGTGAVRLSHGRAVAAAGRHPQDAEPQRSGRRRVVEMRRRPRMREAAGGRGRRGTGTWVIRTDEPQESVEDPLGLQRPTDRADEADPEGLGDSLSDLPEARVVRTPGQAQGSTARPATRSSSGVPGRTLLPSRAASRIPSGTFVPAHVSPPWRDRA